VHLLGRQAPADFAGLADPRDQPALDLAAALLFLGERPSGLQLLGISTTLLSFLGLSVVGRLEGVHFHRNRWVGYMILGTLFGSASGLYDKLLLGRLKLAPCTVQAWFSIYLLVLFAPLAFFWWRGRRSDEQAERFQFRSRSRSWRSACCARILLISRRCAIRPA